MEGDGKTGAFRRLLRLWALYARMDLLWVARDFQMFVMWTVTDSIMNIASVTAMWLLAERFEGIGHWSKVQVLFMLGFGVTVTGLVETFFGFNISFISRRVGRGQMDHLLIQPQPIWMSLLTEGFVPFAGSAILLPGVGLLAWSARTLGMPNGPTWLLLLAVNLLASVTVMLAFQFLWGSLAFWAPRSAEEISSSTMRLMTQLRSYPLDGMGAAMLGGMLSLLPVGFVAWFPCRALLGLQRSPWDVWATPFAAVVFTFLAALMWRRGLDYYGRTGSQWYSDRGHRR